MFTFYKYLIHCRITKTLKGDTVQKLHQVKQFPSVSRAEFYISWKSMRYWFYEVLLSVFAFLTGASLSIFITAIRPHIHWLGKRIFLISFGYLINGTIYVCMRICNNIKLKNRTMAYCRYWIVAVMIDVVLTLWIFNE